eukprot:11401154-Alexandrium_andersonii.AAC.1
MPQSTKGMSGAGRGFTKKLAPIDKSTAINQWTEAEKVITLGSRVAGFRRRPRAQRSVQGQWRTLEPKTAL